MTIYENRPGIVLKNKSYAGVLLLYACDFAILQNVKADQIIAANSQEPYLESCYADNGNGNGSIIITVGHPKYRGDYKTDGTNRLQHIGTLNEDRICKAGVCDLSGLIDADPRADKFTQDWFVDGKRVQLASIDKSDPVTGRFPIGAKATFTSRVSGKWWTVELDNFIRKPILKNCVATNPNGTGISLYGVLDAQIDDCTAFDCLDYGIGIEHGSGRVRRSKGHRNQVSDNAPNGYNQFEAVGLDLGIEFEDCIGKIMRVPKSYGKADMSINSRNINIG